MLAPDRALGRVVEHQRRQSVERRREARLDRLPRLELVPQGSEARGLVVGQQAEQPGGRRLLALRLVLLAHLVVDERVPGVDLDDVVHDDQLQHAPHVDRLGRVLGQHHGHEAEVPGVLRRPLPPRSVRQGAAPLDLLEPIHLEDECELGVEPVAVPRGLGDGRIRRHPVTSGRGSAGRDDRGGRRARPARPARRASRARGRVAPGRQARGEARALVGQPHGHEVVGPVTVGRIAGTADVDEVDLDLEPPPTRAARTAAARDPERSRVRFGHAVGRHVGPGRVDGGGRRRRRRRPARRPERSAPASMAPDRSAAPPGYWSTTSPARAPRVRSRWLSALRATWVSRWPMLQPGSRLGARASSSVRPVITSSKRAWASATRAMSAIGPGSGRSSSVIRRTLLPGRSRPVWGFGPRIPVPFRLRNGHSDHALK